MRLERRLTKDGFKMLSNIRLEPRAEQHYLSILVNLKSHELRRIVPGLRDEVRSWLVSNEISPEGHWFVRHRIINLERQSLRIEVGVPVVGGVEGGDRVQPGSFPPGMYATAVYTGNVHGPGLMRATSEFMVWAQQQGLRWQAWECADGQVWVSRTEFDLTDATEVSDAENHRTKLVFLTDQIGH
jgi:effector-binding domain-containing protein